MPKPVRARTWRPPLPRPAGGPRRRRSSTPGCSSWTRSHPPPASVLRESAARKVSALVWRAHIPDTHAASGPESEAWKDPDPRRRSSRGSGAQNRPVCPAMGATRRLRPVPVSTTSWRYGLRRTSRLVTGRSHRPRSAWPNQARLAFLAVTHRCKRTHWLWLEQFQIAESVWVAFALDLHHAAHKTACYAALSVKAPHAGRQCPAESPGPDIVFRIVGEGSRPRSGASKRR
jgi:hypothetical protein